jgi:glycosyltransferase involved in cell wall biosynthesis
VLHFNSLNKWAIPWVRSIRRLGIPTVFVATMVGEVSSNPLKQALQRLDRSLVLNLVDRVVVSSGVMAQHLDRMGVSTQIEVIPNGVDLERFRPVEDELGKARLRCALGLKSDWEVVLAIGPITERKGIDALLEAFGRICRENSEAHLVLVGPRQDLGAPEFHRRLQDLISRTDAPDRIHFTGPVSNVEDYLRAADLFVFPSRREGMPNVVLEAMACGIPVILTPFLGLPDEFGTPGKHYVLTDWKPEALAADIRDLLAQPDYRRNLGQTGRRWVEESLDVNYSLDRYASLYFGLSNGRASRSHPPMVNG